MGKCLLLRGIGRWKPNVSVQVGHDLWERTTDTSVACHLLSRECPLEPLDKSNVAYRIRIEFVAHEQPMIGTRDDEAAKGRSDSLKRIQERIGRRTSMCHLIFTRSIVVQRAGIVPCVFVRIAHPPGSNAAIARPLGTITRSKISPLLFTTS